MKAVPIADRSVGDGHPCFVIAEAGVNHNGSLKMARQLVDVAADAGAEAVKFQTFRACDMVVRSAPKAEYQLRTTSVDESQFEMIHRLELSPEAHAELIELCRRRGIEFLSSAFDSESLRLLTERFGLPRLKIPSGEVTNGPLLLQAGRSGREVILSTGMSTLGEVETALGALAFGYCRMAGRPSVPAFRDAFVSAEGKAVLLEKVVLLQCTTEYPAPFDDVNLRGMDSLRAAFGLPVGLSDHTPGICVAIAAAARGAAVLEKHFTLDRSLPGPDHATSLEPGELQTMVRSIRQVQDALGSPHKSPALSELKNRDIARKSLVAARPIPVGTVMTEQDLAIKRPGNGVSPLLFWDYLGRPADRDYETDEQLQ